MAFSVSRFKTVQTYRYITGNISLLGDQFVVIPFLNNFTVLQHKNHIELRIVDNRWAMTNTVRPSISVSIPFSIKDSVRVSMELVASSRINTGGSATAARAIAKAAVAPG